VKKLTHIDARGRARMVDVAAKGETRRTARAGGRIRMLPSTLRKIARGGAAKGDVLGVARTAAIQAAKRTSELIPLCHPLALTHVGVDFTIDRKAGAVECVATVSTIGRRGSAHRLRYVQGSRPRDAHGAHPPAGEARRQVRPLAGGTPGTSLTGATLRRVDNTRILG
jgi:molybdenum cofactor biosynthesis protein MoaC